MLEQALEATERQLSNLQVSLETKRSIVSFSESLSQRDLSAQISGLSSRTDDDEVHRVEDTVPEAGERRDRRRPALPTAHPSATAAMVGHEHSRAVWERRAAER